MLPPITIRYDFRPTTRTLATGEVADLFGLADTEPPHTIADQVCLDIRPSEIVLFNGASGSGKSSLLRAAGEHLNALDADRLELPDTSLIDGLHGPLSERLDRLSACGLSEARLLLRRPSELSDGQRYRFRLAYALHTAQQRGHGFIRADEFAAYLDRTLAKVLTFNLRRLVSRCGIGILAATTHDDFIDDLQPDLLVRCLGDGVIEQMRGEVKKKGSTLLQSYGSRRVPEPTGRISLGGIIAVTPSVS